MYQRLRLYRMDDSKLQRQKYFCFKEENASLRSMSLRKEGCYDKRE
jgi:hypothetical protein